jgi:hypothetical protein
MCRRYALENLYILPSLVNLTIIFSDLAYITLNYTFHTSSHDNDHLCFNPSKNDDLMVWIHIFIFLSELWPSTCDIDLGLRDFNFARDPPPHNGVHLCQVILKTLYDSRSSAPDNRVSMTSKCNRDVETKIGRPPSQGANYNTTRFFNTCIKFYLFHTECLHFMVGILVIFHKIIGYCFNYKISQDDPLKLNVMVTSSNMYFLDAYFFSL